MEDSNVINIIYSILFEYVLVDVLMVTYNLMMIELMNMHLQCFYDYHKYDIIKNKYGCKFQNFDNDNDNGNNFYLF